MKRLACKSFVKAVNEDEGTIDKIVSVFNNIDYAKERVLPGAFEDDLEVWEKSGDPIPVIFSHQWDHLESHVGVVDEARELKAGDDLLPDELKDNGGLFVRERYDMEEPFAKRLFRLQKERRIKESSFAYDVVEKKQNGSVTDLVKLKLIEVGPTLKGMNPATQLLDAKANAPVVGSMEERQDALHQAIRAHAVSTYGDEAWAFVEATFDDVVVFTVQTAGEGEEPRTLTLQAPYSFDGSVAELGEAVEVDLEVTIAEREKALKAAKTPPWHIEDDNGDCDGYAVVTDETDEVVGCHDTREEAQRHLEALYANVEEDSKSRGQKAGRVLSKANETKLREAAERLNTVLSSVEQIEEEKSDEFDPTVMRIEIEETVGALNR